MRTRTVLTASASLDASENTHTFYPAVTRPGYPVIFLHGAGLPDMVGANPAWPNTMKLARILARNGIAVAQIYGAGTNMANDTAMSRVTTALATLATRTGCSATKAHLFGVSMGGAWATRYAALNPTKVASVNALVPASSLLNLYAKNMGTAIVGGFASMVATAWGLGFRTVTDLSTTAGSNVATCPSGFTTADNGRLVIVNTAAVTAGGYATPKVPYGTTLSGIVGTPTTATMSNPANTTSASYAAAFADPLPTSGSPNADLVALAAAISAAAIPGRLFYSTVDLYIDPNDVEALRGAANWTKVAIDATFGHADGSMGELAAYNGGTDFSDLITYLMARGA